MRTSDPAALPASQYLLTCDELQNVPFLVLGNKIDGEKTRAQYLTGHRSRARCCCCGSTLAARNAASEDDLRYALGLFETYGKDNKGERDTNVRPIEVFMCSVIRKMGYADGFRWLAQFF